MRFRDFTPEDRQRWPGAKGPSPKVCEGRIHNSDWVDWQGHFIIDDDGLHFIAVDDGHDELVHFQVDLKCTYALAELVAANTPSRVKWSRLEALGFKLEEPLYAENWRYLGPQLTRKETSGG